MFNELNFIKQYVKSIGKRKICRMIYLKTLEDIYCLVHCTSGCFSEISVVSQGSFIMLNKHSSFPLEQSE